jgi:hypothetical protein
VKVVEGGGPAQDYRQCRRMLVGPGVNQPEPYPGYRGFVGWQSPILLHDGTMLVGFSSGDWHASPPTAYFAANPAARDAWKKIGMPTDVDAPRGGRAEIIRSADGGKTWSRPAVVHGAGKRKGGPLPKLRQARPSANLNQVPSYLCLLRPSTPCAIRDVSAPVLQPRMTPTARVAKR